MKRPLLILVIVTAAASARAQSNPTFTYAKPEEVKVDPSKPVTPPVEWKAQVKGGLMVTSGNSQTTNGVFAASASRKEGNNKLALDGGAAYGHSNVINPGYDMVTPTQIDTLDR
ncbi:MAG TPA: hypothetical protein VLT58_15450 [Polyangia bacterium]|nr:hypothetical protein [Polyangia bacterium]